ncbi:MAG: thioredoxin family protein [Crocinitomicaceae bacterium]|nr:thioredoxin family protein [Crocinitomicaceae bacterium]
MKHIMKLVNLFFIGVLFFLSIGQSIGQMEFPEDIVKVKFSVEQDKDVAFVIADVTVLPKWHINASVLPKGSFGLPTKFILNKSTDFKLDGKLIEPKPIEKYDELADENLAYHEGRIKIKQKIKVIATEDFELTGSFNYQTCNDVKCLPDYTYDFKVKIKGYKDATVGATIEESINNNTDEVITQVSTNDTVAPSIEKSSKESFQSKDGDLSKNNSIWVIFGLSFLSGLLALITPCVFPMIPMTVSYFTKSSKTKAKGIKNASLYGLSIVGIYVALGALVMVTGSASKLNEMSTNPWFNIAFFLLLVVFAISFMGAFEITLPNSWVNKADAKADKGGFVGIFFMALVLALVSFSCTGPIVGTLLVEAASHGGITPIVGMFAFGLALALPFTLFAAFPGWLNSMPQSGGWLNSVKVVLGLLELALAFKFLSNADLAWQSHWLEREVFIAIWIAVFGFLTLYLFGMVSLPHDSKIEKLSVGRATFGMITLSFVIYLIPGMWGAPLKLISAFPPPMHYSESPLGVGATSVVSNTTNSQPEGTHLGPQNIFVFHDLEKAEAYAKKVGKPLFIDFTGHNCVNCRKMEQSVWGEPGVIEILRDKVVIASLYVDERTDLPVEEQVEVEYPNGRKVTLKTVGDKWTAKQVIDYKVTSQPYYVMKNTDDTHLDIGSASYQTHRDPQDFKAWLESGLKLFEKSK